MTQIDFEKAVAQIVRDFKHQTEADVRKRWREEHGLIFVREYTVKTHVYRRRPRKRRVVQ